MYIYGKEDIRKIDNHAIEQGFSMYALMENAGRGIFYKVKKLLSKKDRILILSGRGNNGGDGVVLARYLKQNGYLVSLTFPIGPPKTPVVHEHLQFYKNETFEVDTWEPKQDYNVIIDCLLGIGTKLPLQPNIEKIVKWCNHMNCLKIAIDLPTGVVADSGEVKQAFKADYTFCLHGIKPSALFLPSSEFYGTVKTVDIGIKHTGKTRILQNERVKKTFPNRNSAGHKGTFGTSLLIAGSDHMPGSALLGAIGAIRTGTGKLTIATSKTAATIIATRVPEATFIFDERGKMINDHIPPKTTSIAIGPGIDNKKASLVLNKLLIRDIPLVIDAGALIPLEKWKLTPRKSPIILTPHPGEFSRLTNLPIEEIQANRIHVAKTFAKEYFVTVVLKGQNTVIAYPDGEVLVNLTGNNALAKGGSGDVLTGMIVSMLSTHENWKDAIANAVYIHGLCADEWVQKYSHSSLVASDFERLLPIVLQRIESN